MVYNIMYMDTLVAKVTTDENNMTISIEKYISDSPIQPLWGDFSKESKQSLTNRFYGFLKDRCYEDNRADLPVILKQAGLSSNNPYEWVKVSHGVTYEDFFWIRFEGEDNLTWNDVRVR